MFLLISLVLAIDFPIKQTSSGQSTYTLASGKYKIECYGAQGGKSSTDGTNRKSGGRGAYVYGTININGTGTQIYLNVGGKGNQNAYKQNAGGWNGGGSSGKKTGGLIKDDNSGGGGGASDVRIYNNDINNRIIVAAGGSGGAATYEGCPGGDLYGRYWSDANTISPSLLTTQTLGPEDGVGEAGADASDTPGSGGGGGWRGGVSTHKGTSSYAKDAYVAVAHSGSSYISGYKECIITQNVVFEDADMVVDNKENDGQIIINSIYLCSENCFACTSAEVCVKCFDNFYLHENKCVSKCPEGFRGSGSVCEQCRENCKSCESSKDVCDVCFDSYFLYHGQCVTECPEGTRTSGTNCEDCPENCKACETSKDVCSTCNDNYYLNHGQCVTECPEGTRTSGTNCEDCLQDCKSCESTRDVCDACFDTYYLHENKCVSKCPEGFRGSGSVCEQCRENCKSCESSKDVCDACVDTYYLNHGQCVAECPEGTRTSGTNCEDCPENCKSCTTSKEVCDSCADTYFLNHGQCVTECPEGTRTSGTNCEDCPANCKSCATSKDSCEVCFENNYLFNGQCVTECPEGTAVSGNVCELVPASSAPEVPSETIPDIIELTENNCSSKNRCYKEIDNFHQVMVYINVTVFSSLNYTDDGGAIHLVNTGIDCKETVFNECKSKEGSGGAVYIKNSYDFKNSITLEKLTFTQCEAEYGGAIYAYSNSYNNKVLIQKCTFTENIAKAQSTSSHYGGSAIYLTARKGKLYKNKFVRNIGPGGSVKLYNKFEENEQNKMKLLDNNNNQLSFIISSCSFEIEKDTDCSLFYYAGSNGVPFELSDCSFSGNLKSGSHHINGQNAAKDTHKLVIKACKFSSNANDSINMDSENNFVSVDLKQQVFDGQDAKKVKTIVVSWKSVTTIAVPVVAIIVILVLFVLKKSNSNSQNEMNSDNNDNSLAADETINLSLI